MLPFHTSSTKSKRQHSSHDRSMFRTIGIIILIVLSVLLGTFGVLLFLSQKWMLKTWAHLTMDELVFELTAPLEGTSTGILWDYVYSCGFFALSALMILIAVFLLLYRKKTARILLSIICIISGISLTAYSVLHVYGQLDVEEYIENQSTDSTFIADNYVDPSKVTITFPEQKRNLIYIFLESMESTYSSKENGGAYDINYIPDLTDLALNEGNINFSNSTLLGGAYPTVSTTFTMGGLFAQTSGLPLKISVQGNEMAYQDSFFPSLTCLGDILEDNGYTNYFMMGSDATFGGRKNYFQSHGDYNIEDYYWAIDEGKIPSDYYQWWGYEDGKLFEYAKEQLTELGNSGEPFNFSMLTVATHFEDGYLCDQCDLDTYGDHYGTVIACSSARIKELVTWIQEQSWYENTTVIISGDHLTMDSDFCENIDENYNRSVYNCILNSPVQPVKEKERVFTTMDMFPTTLAALGCTIEGNRLGLGTNLFSDQQTLAETLTFSTLNTELAKKSTFFTELDKELVPVWVGEKYYDKEDDRYKVDEWTLYDPYQVWADGEQYYFLDEEGQKVYGWQKIGEYWNYFSESTGALQKGPLMQPDE